MMGGCTFANCVNNVCKACDNGKDLTSNCTCDIGFYVNSSNGCL